MKKERRKIKKEYLTLLFFAVMIALFYGNTLGNGFISDDIGIIEKNPYVKSLKYLPKAITSCMWEGANKGCYGRSDYYRPLQFLSYLLTYQISAQPWFFHLVNLFYFLIAVFLVFTLAKMLSDNFWLSLITATIFLVHPINSEAVNWIACVPELLSTIFVILATIFYLKFRQKPRGSTSGKNLILVYLFYFAAILAKEPAFFLPVVLFFIDWLIFKIKIKKLLQKGELQRYLFFAVPAVIYLLMRKMVLGSRNYLGGFSLIQRFYAFVSLFGQYLGKAFFPYPLEFYRPFNLKMDLISPSFLSSLAAVCLFFGLIVFFIKRRKNLFTLSLIWYFVFLSPGLIFLQAAGISYSHMLSERYLLIPLIGLSLIGGHLLYYFLKLKPSLQEPPDFLNSFGRYLPRQVILIIMVVLLLSSWLVVYNRNKDWKNYEIFSIKVLSQNPETLLFRRDLGYIYLEKGDYENAKIQFEEIINRNPKWEDITMVYKGLGDYYKAKNDLENALVYYQKAVETAVPSPRDFVAFNDLGVVYMEKKDYLKGLVYFCQAFMLYKEAENVINNLNGAVEVIQKEYINQGLIYDQLTSVFGRSIEAKISYIGQECQANSCRFEFTFQSDRPEVIPPFLVSAATLPEKKNVSLKNVSFGQDQKSIFVELDRQDKDLSFIFPTCEGIYYQTVVNANNE